MYWRSPLSLRNVEGPPFERSIDICHETVRTWPNRFGLMVAGDPGVGAYASCSTMQGALRKLLPRTARKPSYGVWLDQFVSPT